jgi:hypothetical protein
MSDCCFGVAPCGDGSISIAAVDGVDVSVKHLEPAQADSSSVVKFVGDRAGSPRICVASTGAWALGLALALGALPQAEVIIIRPAVVSPAISAADGDDIALGLARYARRSA